MAVDYCFPARREKLEDYYQMSWMCLKCAFCRNVYPPDTLNARFAHQCPSGDKFKFEAYYASGRMELIRALLEGDLEWTDRVRHIIYTCTTCGACETWCMFSGRIYPLRAIEKLREHCVKIDQGPMPSHKKFAESIKVNHNPYWESHEKRFVWMPKGITSPIAPPAKAETIYFVGCTSSYRRTEIAQATVKILNHLKIPYAIMGGEEWCCGSPLFRTGQVKAALETMTHDLETLRKIGAKRVIVSCAGCYRVFKEAPRFDLELPVEVLHVTELLAPLIKEGKVEFKEKIAEKLTYHDPCHMGRHLNVYEPPREILTSIPLELVEMPRNRRNAFCCGCGGGVRAEFKDFALETGVKRLEEARALGVNTITSACPFCKHNFIETANEYKLDMKVYDVMEVLAKALGL